MIYVSRQITGQHTQPGQARQPGAGTSQHYLTQEGPHLTWSHGHMVTWSHGHMQASPEYKETLDLCEPFCLINGPE